MTNVYLNLDIVVLFQLALAMALGALLGVERELSGKEAGMRTYALVALGSALFVIMGMHLFYALEGTEGVSFDPSRLIHAIALGIGFIGAGIIIYRDRHVEGITTAAGVWVAGAIGATVGFGFYATAIFATVFAFFVLSGLRPFKKLVRKKPKSSKG